MMVTAGGRRASTAELFDALSSTYDQTGVTFFRPVAERLLDLVAVRHGERVLDIGCGRGAGTLPLARAVGREGRVTAVDVSPKMVAATRALLARERLGNAVVVIGDASRLRIGRGFDAAFASLVLPLMDSPDSTLRHWLGLLRPGGRLALTTVDAVDDATRALAGSFDRWLRQGSAPARPTSLDPYDGSRLLVQLRQAGAVDLDTGTETATLEFTDVEDWRRFSMSTAQRSLWRRVPLDEQPRFVDRAATLLEAARGADGMVRLHWGVRYTLARRPGD